jgi:N-methylhydantoinase B
VSLAAGGGGYGDPCERDVEAVMDDLVEGRISGEAALAVYGVVTTNGTLDSEATARERESRRPAYTPSV